MQAENGAGCALNLESEAKRMNTAMSRLRQQHFAADQCLQQHLHSEPREVAQANAFAHDRRSSEGVYSNCDGGPFYGVNERDNWLLAKEEGTQD